MSKMTIGFLLLAFTCLQVLPSTDAFFASKPVAKRTSVSPFTDEAISIYDKNFPFGREPPKPNPFIDFGMPNQDFDGTRIKSKNPSKKRLTDITPDQAKKSFNELARLYGDERALSMVKALPICLAFDNQNFDKCLENWTNVFGLEASQDMVARNPGLLAVRAEEASKATDSTMVFSYLVAFTRPLGPILLATLFLLILTPTIEALTGVQYGINH